MDIPQIDEIAGYITTAKAMAMLRKTNPQIMTYIRKGMITAAKWDDRYMLVKTDVERIAENPPPRGRPPQKRATSNT